MEKFVLTHIAGVEGVKTAKPLLLAITEGEVLLGASRAERCQRIVKAADIDAAQIESASVSLINPFAVRLVFTGLMLLALLLYRLFWPWESNYFVTPSLAALIAVGGDILAVWLCEKWALHKTVMAKVLTIKVATGPDVVLHTRSSTLMVDALHHLTNMQSKYAPA